MGTHHVRQLIYTLALAFTLMATALAGTNSPARTALENKNYDQVISLLTDKADKSAEEYYLLGKACYEKGDKAGASEAWKECNLIARNLSSKTRWNFLFPAGKSLTAAQKKKLYEQYQTESKSVFAVAMRGSSKTATGARNEAARTNIEANRLSKKADAKSEAIRDKQHVADRRALTGQTGNPRLANAPRTATGKGKGCGPIGLIIVILIVVVIVAAMIFGRRSEPDHVMHGNTDALDREILEDIDEREAMRNEVADMEAEADHLEQDAVEADQEREELEEASEVVDEEPDFEDDEPEAEEPEPEEEEPAFEDDEAEEEEPE